MPSDTVRGMCFNAEQISNYNSLVCTTQPLPLFLFNFPMHQIFVIGCVIICLLKVYGISFVIAWMIGFQFIFFFSYLEFVDLDFK
jgi:hypothetical protein